jgi:Tol biopolymer transport system component
MSPEQARGYKVDQRTDIWAFGAVVYEMLAGQTMFGGETATDVLGAIVHRDPDWKLLPDSTPRRVRMLLQRCLRKDPKRRLQAIGDARVTIVDYLEDPAAAEAFVGGDAAPAWQRLLPWGVAAAAVLVLGAVLLRPAPIATQAPVVRSEIPLGLDALFLGPGTSVAISPDGRFLAAQEDFSTVAPDGDLFLRPLDAPTLTSLVVGQQGDPFFSPDSEWVVFAARDALFKVPVTGGTPQRIVPVQSSRGASWGPDGTIVFAPSSGAPLMKVSALGGTPEQVTTLDSESGEATHRWPSVLPDGSAVLFTTLNDANERAIHVAELDGSGRKQVYPNGTDARYLPTGHIVFADAASLFAAPFDLGRREITGAAIPVVEGVFTDGAGRAHWSVSENGVLVYRSGTIDVPVHPIVSVAVNGDQQLLWKEPATFLEPRLSPDGRKLAVCQLGSAGLDIWVYDLAREVPTRLTFDDADDCPAVWSPDGEQVIFSSAANGALDLYRKRADGSGDIERLTEAPDSAFYVSDWSPDGEHVILTAGNGDLLTLQLQEGAEPEPYLMTDFGEAEADISPDGRWITYQSNESGRNEIYVRPFPAGAGKWQVSTGGGAYPRWSLDGRQVYYRTDAGLSAATVDVEQGALSIGNARPVLTGSFRGGVGGISVNNSIWADWAVAPDERFVLFPAPDSNANGANATLQVVTNWFEELNRRVPTGR